MDSQNEMVFCTLFDSNYLDKGLTLYRSMKKHIDNFKFYIFAFDEKCFKILSDMQLENVIPVSVEDIMTDTLWKIKEERICAEFCFTCTPIVIEHVLLKYKEKICTYIDADIYFFSNPGNAIREIMDNDCSVGLVCHGFERNYEYVRQIFGVGKYCIQFNTFLNNKEGMQVLREWKKDCLNWCYYRYEDEKFGDQKYPDKWRQKYSGVHESRNLGVGVAPWNLHLYSCVGKKDGTIWMKHKGRKFPLIFYHFEGMKYLSADRVFLNIWKASVPEVRKKIRILYGEYFRELEFVRKYLAESYDISFKHMIIEDNLLFKRNHSLKHFCEKYGLLVGMKIWAGFWTNNVSTISRLCKK